MLPSFPFVVLDMNTMRLEDLVRPLINAHALATHLGHQRVSLMLPQIANWELTRGAPTTVARSFRVLADRPEAVMVARHSYLLKGLERGELRRLPLGSIIDHRQTRALRSVLRGLRDDTHDVDPSTVVAIRDSWRSALDNEDEPGILRELVAIHQRALPQRRANDIRHALQEDPPDREPFIAWLTEAVGKRADLAKFLRGVGYGSSMAKRLARFASFSLGHYLAMQATAARWRIFGGHQTASDHTLENAMIDSEYALLAAHGRGYVTLDEGARDVYEAVVAVSNRIWRRRQW